MLKELLNQWNTKIKKLRWASFILCALMMVAGVLCFMYPVKSILVIQVVAAVLIGVHGIFEIVDYFSMPKILRDAISIASGVLNIIISFMLITGPAVITASTFAFMIGFALMSLGINKISFGSRLRNNGIKQAGWITFGGVMSVLASICMILFPLMSTVVLNYIIATYLVIGSISLLVEAINMGKYKID